MRQCSTKRRTEGSWKMETNKKNYYLLGGINGINISIPAIRLGFLELFRGWRTPHGRCWWAAWASWRGWLAHGTNQRSRCRGSKGHGQRWKWTTQGFSVAGDSRFAMKYRLDEESWRFVVPDSFWWFLPAVVGGSASIIKDSNQISQYLWFDSWQGKMLSQENDPLFWWVSDD